MAQYIRGLLELAEQRQAPRRDDRRLEGRSPGPAAPAGRRPRRRPAPGPGQGSPARRADPRVKARRAGHRPDGAPEPGRGRPATGIHGVLSMPFSGFDLLTRISKVRTETAAASTRRRPRGSSRSSPRRAASARRRSRSTSPSRSASSSQRTVLIDGSLQFGDLRALLKVPVDAPSILDLPTDRVAGIGPPGRPLARSVRDRHPARAAAGRDGRDDHGPRHRQGPVAPAPGLRLDRRSTCRRS